MKKQICFAGFGDVELEALQPSLAAFNATWNCTLAHDQGAALEVLASSTIDAIVVNLNLTSISTPDFLHEASVRHPHTLRFVLGDVADREAAVNCMGAPHQFISRPWKPRELVSIIERSLALDNWLSTDKLREFVPHLGKLPGLPSTYFEVLKRAESPNSSIESIAEVISHDPTLTVRLLQMVNSPACGLNKKVTSPTEAVSMLGMDTVKSLVLCLQLFANASPAEGAGISSEQLWRHSFNVAKLAAKIVVNCISSEGMASEAYTAGLLHNIGQIVLATNLSREYSEVIQTARKKKRPVHEVEMEQLGVTSNQVGGYLLGLWGMPLPIVEATALHHIPATASTQDFSLLTVVHIANVLASQDSKGVNGLPLPELDEDYLSTLGLPRKTDAWRKILSSGTKTPEPEKPTAQLIRPKAPPPKPPSRPLPIKKILVGFGIATAVVAVVAFRQRAVPMAESVAAAISSVAKKTPPAAKPDTAKPVAEPGVAAATSNTPGGPSPFDSLELQTILYSPSHAVAMINGKSLEVGDFINGAKVVEIKPSQAVLAYQGVLHTFNLKPQ